MTLARIMPTLNTLFMFGFCEMCGLFSEDISQVNRGRFQMKKVPVLQARPCLFSKKWFIYQSKVTKFVFKAWNFKLKAFVLILYRR